MHKMKLVLMLSLFTALILSACGGSDAEATPTMSMEQVETMAVMTYQAQLTETALAHPSSTPLPTSTPIPVVTFSTQSTLPSVLPTNTTISNASASTCYGLSYVSDVTIPDNTEVKPGQSFTKTWKVLNSGTCAWESGFKFNVVGGDPIGGVAVTLNQRVEPGSQYEFSVPMVVPTNKSGELRGTWRLSDANGTFFGDGVYVLVKVTGTAASTATSYPNP